MVEGTLESSVKPPRGRPTNDRVAAIQEAILAVALKMFLQEGYNVTSMEAIAARAGISKGTLYARYPSKPDLYTAVVEDRVAAWSRAASLQDEALPADLVGRLKHLVRISLHSMADPEIAAFGEMISAERKRFPELARIYFERAVGYEVTMLAADIAATSKQEGIQVRSPDAAARALLQMALGWSSLRALSGGHIDQDEIDQAADHIVALLTQGLAAW